VETGAAPACIDGERSVKWEDRIMPSPDAARPPKPRALEDRVALVTGASRNIGRAIALALAEAGATVMVNGRSDQAAAEAVAREIEAGGGRAAARLADIAEESAAQALVEATRERFGRLDILVLNAAVRRECPLAEISFADWRAVLSVTLDGAFLLARAAAPALAASAGGRIVAIGGSPSHLGTAGRAHVCAAKMGLVGLTRVLATELGGQGVTANCVAPGHIDTLRGASAGAMSTVTAGRPIPRRGTPEEIAAAVRFLCLPEAGYITGQTRTSTAAWSTPAPDRRCAHTRRFRRLRNCWRSCSDSGPRNSWSAWATRSSSRRATSSPLGERLSVIRRRSPGSGTRVTRPRSPSLRTTPWIVAGSIAESRPRWFCDSLPRSNRRTSANPCAGVSCSCSISDSRIDDARWCARRIRWLDC